MNIVLVKAEVNGCRNIKRREIKGEDTPKHNSNNHNNKKKPFFWWF